jgi:hypothetical protein
MPRRRLIRRCWPKRRRCVSSIICVLDAEHAATSTAIFFFFSPLFSGVTVSERAAISAADFSPLFFHIGVRCSSLAQRAGRWAHLWEVAGRGGLWARQNFILFFFFLLQVLDAQRSALGEVGFGDGAPLAYQGAKGLGLGFRV